MIQEKPTDAGLSADLFTEILLRLPAKSVCRFRCVSKPWRSLSSDPHFLRSHPSTAPADSAAGIFLYDAYERPADFFSLKGKKSRQNSAPTLSFLGRRGRPAEPVDSCNGLVLCRLPESLLTKNEPAAISVANPTTKEHEVIRLPEDLSYTKLLLAFDPSRSPSFWIIAVDHYRPYRVHRYFSKTCSWTVIGNEMRWSGRWSHSVFWNGLLIWADQSCNTFLSLDMEEDRQHKLFPRPSLDSMKFMHLGESRGRLHFVRGSSCASFEILEMSSHCFGWHLLHRVDLGSVIENFGNKIVEFIRGEGDLVLFRLHSKIVSYHLQTTMFTDICKVDSGTYDYKSIFPLVPTLSPLNPSPAIQDGICWKDEHDRVLIGLLVEHSTKGAKTKTGFKSDSWMDMVDRFNEATQLNYVVLNLKDRLSSYKREYKKVKKIISNDGFRWDPTDLMVKADDGSWRKCLKKNPKAAVFKRKLVHFNHLETICALSTELDGSSPQHTAPFES